eukprot:gnl/TRDRNA2_/TRDRNA2_122077_c2_seq1.p1 gnl/TRDRNA2_/TRDRNA2_122077_c2~~gnl/TRDRNA2_/TRDRNA2_122077_c2_seq1.p1  ORF type:complete len:178 (-),score=1.66 gnl/TRDRNA2_/TRDRNA2_122077_c2_seq1:87-620(-)
MRGVRVQLSRTNYSLPASRRSYIHAASTPRAANGTSHSTKIHVSSLPSCALSATISTNAASDVLQALHRSSPVAISRKSEFTLMRRPLAAMLTHPLRGDWGASVNTTPFLRFSSLTLAEIQLIELSFCQNFPAHLFTRGVRLANHDADPTLSRPGTSELPEMKSLFSQLQLLQPSTE